VVHHPRFAKQNEMDSCNLFMGLAELTLPWCCLLVPGAQDPLNLSEDLNPEKVSRYQAIEIKHGRIAMLAMCDYFHRGFPTGHVSRLVSLNLSYFTCCLVVMWHGLMIAAYATLMHHSIPYH